MFCHDIYNAKLDKISLSQLNYLDNFPVAQKQLKHLEWMIDQNDIILVMTLLEFHKPKMIQ